MRSDLPDRGVLARCLARPVLGESVRSVSCLTSTTFWPCVRAFRAVAAAPSSIFLKIEDASLGLAEISP